MTTGDPDMALYRSLRKKGLSSTTAREIMKTMGIDFDPGQGSLQRTKATLSIMAQWGKPDRADKFPYYHHKRKF